MVVTQFLADITAFADREWVQTWTGVLSLLILVILVQLVRRGRLKASYSLLWFGAWASCTFLTRFPDWLDRVSNALGIHYSPTFLLLFFCFVLGLIALHTTIVLTRLTRQFNKLVQEMAVLKEELGRQCED